MSSTARMNLQRILGKVEDSHSNGYHRTTINLSYNIAVYNTMDITTYVMEIDEVELQSNPTDPGIDYEAIQADIIKQIRKELIPAISLDFTGDDLREIEIPERKTNSPLYFHIYEGNECQGSIEIHVGDYMIAIIVINKTY